jgi:predicted porin
MGVTWQSHGTPFNKYLQTGDEYLISKNSNKSRWNLAPNALSQSNLGVRGNEEIVPGYAFVFNLEAGFDPYSLQAANGVKSLAMNNGKALADQSSNADSSRAGQFYNSQGYAGISSKDFGTLVVGRVNSLTLDGVNSYDPLGGSNAFSPIGYSGATAGTGNTEDARFTTAAKYRVNVGPVRASALYQFGGYDLGNASTQAYQFGIGGDINGGPVGTLSLDGIYSHVTDGVSLATLSAAQNLKYPGTLAATISNNTSVMLLAKYKWKVFQVYGGYETITFQNPSNPKGSFTSIGDFDVVSANVTNNAYTIAKHLQIFWTGLRIAVSSNVDISTGYYHYLQSNYNKPACSNLSSGKCRGTLDAASVDVDWKITPKLDAYAGVMFSSVNNGLANGYLFHTSVDPTVGARLRF